MASCASPGDRIVSREGLVFVTEKSSYEKITVVAIEVLATKVVQQMKLLSKEGMTPSPSSVTPPLPIEAQAR